MAKKKTAPAKTSKSDAIRAVLAARPNAGGKEIRSALDAKGIKASDALINKIKYTRKPGGRKAAPRKNGGSKAAAIRAKFEQLGSEARPRDVIAALKDEGVQVTSAQVSMLRGKLSGGGGSRGKRSQAGIAVPYEHLVAAKQLADRLGGVDQARRALESFAGLVSG